MLSQPSGARAPGQGRQVPNEGGPSTTVGTARISEDGAMPEPTDSKTALPAACG